MDAQLTDKVVLISGGAGGIGSAMVRAFHAEGARVVVHYRTNRDRANALVRELGAERTVALEADLTDESEVERLFAEAHASFGPVDVCIANAGKWPPEDTPIHRMTLEQWQGTIAANLTSAFLCARAFFRGIVEHNLTDPALVLIASTAGVFGEAGHADYAAAKGALASGLLLSLKNEIARIAPRGRVNAICPGWTITDMTRDFQRDPDKMRRVLQTWPTRRVGRAIDVARMAVMLASPALSGHVSGQSLTVAGGMEGRVLYTPDEIDIDTA